MKVDFFIVGAPKAGTTSLYHYLNEHPQVEMSLQKEPNYFSDKAIQSQDLYYNKNRIDTEEKYNRLFNFQKKDVIFGEGSVSYLFYPKVASRIKKYNTNAKIIIMIRNPIERAFSGYLHNLRYNPSENLTFKEAIKESERRYHVDKDITPDTRYLYVGEYYSQVRAFVNAFKENVHIIFYDDYVKDIDSCLSKLFTFLKIQDIKIDTSTRYMLGGWMFKNKFVRNLLIPENNFKSFFKSLIPSQMARSFFKRKIMSISTINTPEINKEMRRKLIRYYRNDIVNLSVFLNKKLDHWLDEN